MSHDSPAARQSTWAVRSSIARRIDFLLPVAMLATLACATSAQNRAAEPPERPRAQFPWDPRAFADPQRMLESFFGPLAEADREMLENVPISRRDEQRFGDQAAQAYLEHLRRQGVSVVRRGEDVAYLRQLVQVVQSRMRNRDRYPKLRVILADSPITEANCFPGGTLVFCRGILDYAGSEAALVGVIGHELSHIDHGHQLHLMRRMKMAEQSWAGQGGFSPEHFLQGGAALMKAFLRPFRPEEELAADRDGAAWAYELGYDPRAFGDLFRKMHARGPGMADHMPSFLRSHPDHLARHRTVMEVYEELLATDPSDDLYVGRENLRLRIPRREREFEE
jgi:Zn-dependent protease with chaperone function